MFKAVSELGKKEFNQLAKDLEQFVQNGELFESVKVYAKYDPSKNKCRSSYLYVYDSESITFHKVHVSAVVDFCRGRGFGFYADFKEIDGVNRVIMVIY